LRDEPGRNHGFAECRCGRQNTDVMLQQGVRSRLLAGTQLAAKGQPQGLAAKSLIRRTG